MMRLILLLLILGACTVTATNPAGKLNTLSAADLATAEALATAAGDANGAACWTYLSSIMPALQPPATVGAATSFELARLPFQPTFAAKCGPAGLSLPAPMPLALPVLP